VPEHTHATGTLGFTDGRLPDTGERDALVALLGDVRGRAVLDLGGTDPYLGRQVLDGGARRYVGLVRDVSPFAAAGLTGGAAEIHQQDLDSWSGHGLGRFDAALSRRALHHVRNLARLLDTLRHHLLPDARLVFSVRHPLMTAGVTRLSPDGTGIEVTIRDYLDDGPAPSTPTVAAGELPARHRRFDTYIRELRYSGFRLEELVETADVAPSGDGVPAWAVFRCTRRG
jgi:SAM-dependent methyltransferase